MDANQTNPADVAEKEAQVEGAGAIPDAVKAKIDKALSSLLNDIKASRDESKKLEEEQDARARAKVIDHLRNCDSFLLVTASDKGDGSESVHISIDADDINRMWGHVEACKLNYLQGKRD